jgi:membrane-bound lytic murein transglycosylase D
MRLLNLLALLSLAILFVNPASADHSAKHSIVDIEKAVAKLVKEKDESNLSEKPSSEIFITKPAIKTKTKSNSLWDQISLATNLEFNPNHPRIIRERMRYLRTPEYLAQVSKRAEPFFFHIVDALKKQNLPVELALLPMIESAYISGAVSKSGAAGLWQFIPATGQHFGIKRNQWYDGRHDVRASTKAATQYLKKLHKIFDGDWLLVLAAYNAGENTILKQMDRNRTHGKPADYWNLQLREEPAHYVPKFLALLSIIHHAEDYGVKLWSIKNAPFFTTINITNQTSLQQLAKKLNVNLKLLTRLNAGLSDKAIPAKQKYELIVPTSTAAKFRSTNPEKPGDASHQVAQGETLSQISRRYDVSVNQLKKNNRLDSDNIRPGQTLIIPGS